MSYCNGWVGLSGWVGGWVGGERSFAYLGGRSAPGYHARKVEKTVHLGGVGGWVGGQERGERRRLECATVS